MVLLKRVDCIWDIAEGKTSGSGGGAELEDAVAAGDEPVRVLGPGARTGLRGHAAAQLGLEGP